MWAGKFVFAIVLLASVEPLGAQILHPKLKSNEITLASFAVMPPFVEGSSPKLGADEVKSRAKKLSSELADLTEEILGEMNWEVKGALREENIAGEETKQALGEVQTAYNSLAKRLHNKPNDVSKGLYTLGETIHKLDNIVEPDALMFISATADFYDVVKSSKTANVFTVSITSKRNVIVLCSVVDAKNGDVLYFFGATGKGNYRQSLQDLRNGIAAALRKLTAPTLSVVSETPRPMKDIRLTNAERILTWKGEKVTILGTIPARCKIKDADSGPRMFRPFEDNRDEKPLFLNRYASRTGTIIDAKFIDSLPEITIQLDDGEKIISSNDWGLGFQAELEAARKLIGSPMWTKGSQSLARPESLCGRDITIRPSDRLTLKNLEKVTVIAAEFGTHLQRLYLTVRTEYGRQGILDGWDGYDYLDSRFHLEGGLGVETHHFSERFYFEDPRKK